MLKIRRSQDCLIINMGIALLVRHLYTETAPWCCQATNHYPGQCWPGFMSPCDITRPQWVKNLVDISQVSMLSWHLSNRSIIQKIYIYHFIYFNTLRPRQNGRQFSGDIPKCIFLNGNVWISIKIPLEFVPKGPINNIPSLVQIMVWHRPTSDKPLSQPMMDSLLMHICVTRLQWVKHIFSWDTHDI